MYRINDHPSRADLTHQSKSNLSISDQESNIEDNMLSIQNNINMMYEQNKNSNYHLGSYGVQATSCFTSLIGASNKKGGYNSANKQPQDTLINYSSNRNYFDTSNYMSQAQDGKLMDGLLDEKNTQILLLKRQLKDLRDNLNGGQVQSLENYEQMINSFKREAQQLIQQNSELEANLSLAGQRIQDYENQMEEKDQIIVQLQEQLMNYQNTNQEGEDRFQVLSNKTQVFKDEIASLVNKLTYQEVQSQNTQKQYQDQLEQVQQQNQQFKLMIEDLQYEGRMMVQDQEQNRNQGEYFKIVTLLTEVTETVTYFIQQYNLAADETMHSAELKKLIYQFGLQHAKGNVIEQVGRFTNLIISLFEQLQINVSEIKGLNQDTRQLEMQVIQLETMTVSLEKSIIEYESQHQHMEQVIDRLFASNKHRNEKDKEQADHVQELRAKLQNDYSNLEKVIQNLEELNLNIQKENQQLGEQVQSIDAELQNSRKYIAQEQNRTRYSDTRLKKLYQDSLYFKDIISKLSGLFEDKQIVDSILITHKDATVCCSDEVEIRNQLDAAESQLKQSIQAGKLTTKEMIEKRRDVEVLRSALRNCEDQRKSHQDKLEHLNEELDKIIILHVNELAQQNYFIPSRKEIPQTSDMWENNQNATSI